MVNEPTHTPETEKSAEKQEAAEGGARSAPSAEKPAAPQPIEQPVPPGNNGEPSSHSDIPRQEAPTPPQTPEPMPAESAPANPSEPVAAPPPEPPVSPQPAESASPVVETPPLVPEQPQAAPEPVSEGAAAEPPTPEDTPQEMSEAVSAGGGAVSPEPKEEVALPVKATPPSMQDGSQGGGQEPRAAAGGDIDDVHVGGPQEMKDAGTNVQTAGGEITVAGEKIPTMRLGERLVAEGLISEDQLSIALKVQRDSDDSKRAMLGAILVDLGFITESALGEVLAESTGVEKFDPKSAVLDPNLIKQIPKSVAMRHKVVPVLLEDNSVYLAMADIYNVLAIDQIQRHFPKNYRIVPVYCPETEIMELIDNYYDYELSIDGILKEIETGLADENNKLSGEVEGYVNPTVRLVDSLLIDAVKRGASDVHFEPEGTFLRLRYRVDGKMHQIRSFHKDYWAAIAVRIKIISGMNIAEVRNPQDGRITYNVLGREVDFRVATHPTIHGENIVLRILDKKKALVPMEKLGFSADNTQLLQKLIKRPEGIIIVTGPTGSGKTTTLYSILNHINSVDVNIMTLEDPVEYQLSMIRQSNIRHSGGMDFASGLKSAMRQDPDIIFVGEVRDHETAEMALRAAMTGHQVYSTLHTNDALGAIPRLVDIGLKPSLLAGAVICVVAQRLGRKLCGECAESRPATEEECKILGVESNPAPVLNFHVGCDICSNTGYKGRIAISEVLPVDKELDELIAVASTRMKMLDHASTRGFRTMVEDGIQKVLDGIIDLDELIRTIDMTERL